MPFYEVSRFLDDNEVNNALQRLKNNRDNQFHLKGAEGLDIQGKFRESVKALRTLLQSVEFLSEYSLRYTEETRRDTISGVTRYSYRELMGDHPIVPLKEGETEESEVEAGSLQLVDRNGKLHLLRPLLVRRECPQCGRWATFYLDSYDASQDVCILKAMEHTHTFEDQQIAYAFRHMGLLLPKQGN